MKHSHLKNSLVAAGIAVFAGVITLGANVAFGVTNPSQKPVDATLVSPTFGGVDVRGWLTNGTGDPVTAGNEGFQSWGTITALNNLNVQGAIGNPINGSPVDINDAEGIRVSGPITALAALFVEPSFGLQSRDPTKGIVVIKDNLFIAGHNAGIGGYGVHVDGNKGSITTDSGTLIVGSSLNAQGSIKNTTLNNGGDVVIEDNLKVTGDAKVRSLEVTLNGIDVPTGAVTAEQFIANGGVEGAFMKTTGAITAGALILSPDNNMGIESSGAGGVKINDPLDAWETIINTNKNNVGVDLPVKIDDNFAVTGNVNASRDLSLGSNVNDQRFLFHSRNNGSGDFLQITNDKADGSWDWSNGIVMRRGSAENSPSTQFHVNGKITSTNGFGTYSKVVGTPSVNIAAGASGEGSATCGSLQLISCQNIDFNINHLLMGIRSDSNTCYVSAKNISTNQTMKVTAVAICLNPKL